MRLPKRPSRPTWTRPDHDPDAFQASLVDHLEELRNRIIRSLFVIAGAWVLGWFVLPYFYGAVDHIARTSIVPRLPKGTEFKEVFSSATEPFMLKMRLSFSIGLFFAIPFIVRQLWGFVAPGLKPREQEPFRKIAPWTIVFFLMGAGMSLLILPSALIWFTSYLEEFPNTSLYQGAGTLSYFVIKMMTAFGIGFQIPVVVYTLGYLGLLTSETLFKHWRHAATFIFIAAMIITPSNDPFSMLMMAIPMTLLFVGSAYAVKGVQKKRALEVAEEEAREAAMVSSGPTLVTPDAVIPRGTSEDTYEEVPAPRDDA